ncbi:MAG: DMT family transporter [Nitrospinota bacterium]|jgi:uncharacterized membrane protein|nr:DMT family transporter [Nitrospinota bacterium]MDP6484452.1 DMT family transporter [Nitrospinota bacterium]MDP6619768.1 DMT family transporter [Nitrospinota bacterium]HJM43232.1 DMT family transporter [Nitrospinota bacterium]
MTPTPAILAALIAALFYALSDVCLRNALRFATPISACIAMAAVECAGFTALAVAGGLFSALTLTGLLWFVLAGFLNPVLFLTFYLLGIQRIGVARSAPIKGSGPIFATAFAVAVMGERLTPFHYLGIGLVVAGIVTISAEKPQSRPAASGKLSAWGSGAVFPLLAGVSAGIASNIFKISMTHVPSPLLGAWVGVTEGLLFYPILAFLFPRENRFRFDARRAWPWIVPAGLTAMVSLYSVFYAVSLGQVPIVFTLVQTSPLFVILFSILMLRRLERVTRRVIFGGLLTVGGGAWVILA